MQLEVGSVVEGKVENIKKFGAFVHLPNDKVGLLHISEVAHEFVNNVNDYLSEGQIIKVKILKIEDNGNIALSLKETLPQPSKQQSSPRVNLKNKSDNIYNNNNKNYNIDNDINDGKNKRFKKKTFEWRGLPKKNAATTFEEMMTAFKQTSEEKMSDLKRITESKRGGYPRRGSQR